MDFMKILVAIKLSYDINQMKYDERTGEPILDAVPLMMGDMDRCAIEAALQIKEAMGGTVDFISIGRVDSHNKMMMDAYAMGCDKGYLIEAEDSELLNAYTVSRVIANFVKKFGPYDLIIMGATSQDTHSSLVPPSVAALLNYKAALGVDKISIAEDVFTFEATYEDGIYTYRLTPPLLLSVTTEANIPRIPTLKDILKAKRMKYDSVSLNELVEPTEVRKVNVARVGKYVTPRKRELIEVSTEEDVEKAVERIIELFREAEVI